MPPYPCPICHDPNGFPLWLGSEPPDGCPHDDAWHERRPRTVNSVSDCPYQRAKAEQAAEWRLKCPEAFDKHGNIKPGGLAMVITKLKPTKPTII